MHSNELNDVSDEYHQFCSGFRSVMLSTISQFGIADSSYEEYVRYDDDYYVFACEVGDHTTNLFNTGKASLIFLERGSMNNVRPDDKRVVLNAVAQHIDRSSQLFKAILTRFAAQVRDFPVSIIERSDFHLFRIKPKSGVFVRKAGEAYLIDNNTLRKADLSPRTTSGSAML